MVAFSSLLAPAGTGLLFRENGCLIMSESSGSGSSPSTLFQTCYRLFAEKNDLSSAYLYDFIMNAQSEKMRSHQRQIQKMLLREFDASRLGANIESSLQLIACPTGGIHLPISAR